jgi:hypothetical protein
VLKSAAFLRFAKRKPVPAIKKHHKAARLAFALKRATKNDFWERVTFSDEKKFNLDGPDGFRYYWEDLRREPEVHSKRVCGGGSVMVWAGIKWYGKTELVFLEGKQDSIDYQTTLRGSLIPFIEKLRSEHGVLKLVFQHDNASIHASRSIKAFLRCQTFSTMDWPAKSPDFNPIENVWGQLSRLVFAGGRQFDSREQLKQQIRLSWSQISQDYIDKLIRSMPTRMIWLSSVAAPPSTTNVASGWGGVIAMSH